MVAIITRSLLLATVATAATAAVLPRSIQSILTNLQAVNSNIHTLLSAAESYTGGVWQAIPIAQANSALQAQLQAAADDVYRSDVISANEAAQVIDFVEGALGPAVESVATVLRHKQGAITAAGFQGEVLSAMREVLGSVRIYGRLIAEKIPVEKTKEMQGVMKETEDKLAEVARAYS